MPVADALAAVLALTPRMPAERVPLEEAVGRVLLEDVMARRAQPPFRASAMDGYAVRAREATTGAVLRLAGEAAAGSGFGGPLPDGAAVRIFTGAPVPDGADAILIQEDAAAIAGGAVEVRAAPTAGAYIRPEGGDFSAGAKLAAPRRLTPRDVALAAAMNLPELPVARRPGVAFVPTGDELVWPGEAPGADQIVTSNNFGLAALAATRGAIPRLCRIARDTAASLADALAEADGADIVVTLGGASVGKHDLVAQLGQSQGFARSFYKIAMRPGKPLICGRLGTSVFLGLPGNPVSAMICGEIFLVPAIDAALGLAAGPRTRQRARLDHALPANGVREHYCRAVLSQRGETHHVTVFENQDSSLLRVLAHANAVAVRPPHAGPAEAGDWIDVIPLDGGGIRARA